MASVVIALDSSIHSDYSLEYYFNYIHRDANKVHTVYVAEYFGSTRLFEGPSPGVVAELEEQDQQRANAIDAQVSELFRDKKVDGDFTRVFGKDTWHAILEFANYAKATMIIIGSRGQGSIRRTLMGSVSDAVVHHSHIPVLVCKHPDLQHQK